MQIPAFAGMTMKSAGMTKKRRPWAKEQPRDVKGVFGYALR